MRKISLEYGLFLFMCLMGFFMFMFMLNHAANINLRYLNSVIHATILYIAIKEYYKSTEHRSINYFKGLSLGISVSLVGIILFVIFQLIFMSLNPGFLETIKANFIFGSYLNPFTVAIGIFIEGLSMSILGSYAIILFIESTSKDAYLG